MAGDGGGLDVWVDFDGEARNGLELVTVIVHLRRYAEALVLSGEVDVAARAARLILDHPPLAASSRQVLAVRFPQHRDGREAA